MDPLACLEQLGIDRYGPLRLESAYQVIQGDLTQAKHWVLVDHLDDQTFNLLKKILAAIHMPLDQTAIVKVVMLESFLTDISSQFSVNILSFGCRVNGRVLMKQVIETLPLSAIIIDPSLKRKVWMDVKNYRV